VTTEYNSLASFTAAVKIIDATADVYQPLGADEAFALLFAPPDGKQLSGIQGGVVNGFTIIFNDSGNPIYFKRKGSHYLLTDSLPSSNAKVTPFQVETLKSPKALEDYLKQYDPACVVNTYVGGTIPDGWDFITSSPGIVTTITNAPSNLITVLAKGGFYTLVFNSSL